MKGFLDVSVFQAYEKSVSFFLMICYLAVESWNSHSVKSLDVSMCLGWRILGVNNSGLSFAQIAWRNSDVDWKALSVKKLDGIAKFETR